MTLQGLTTFRMQRNAFAVGRTIVIIPNQSKAYFSDFVQSLNANLTLVCVTNSQGRVIATNVWTCLILQRICDLYETDVIPPTIVCDKI